MKLTIKQLQQNTEDRLGTMAARLDRVERGHEELHLRLDRQLIRLENSIAEFRSEMSEFRSEMSEFRNRMDESRNEMMQLMKVLNSTFTKIEHRLTNLESCK